MLKQMEILIIVRKLQQEQRQQQRELRKQQLQTLRVSQIPNIDIFLQDTKDQEIIRKITDELFSIILKINNYNIKQQKKIQNILNNLASLSLLKNKKKIQSIKNILLSILISMQIMKYYTNNAINRQDIKTLTPCYYPAKLTNHIVFILIILNIYHNLQNNNQDNYLDKLITKTMPNITQKIHIIMIRNLKLLLILICIFNIIVNVTNGFNTFRALHSHTTILSYCAIFIIISLNICYEKFIQPIKNYTTQLISHGLYQIKQQQVIPQNNIDNFKIIITDEINVPRLIYANNKQDISRKSLSIITSIINNNEKNDYYDNTPTSYYDNTPTSYEI